MCFRGFGTKAWRSTLFLCSLPELWMVAMTSLMSASPHRIYNYGAVGCFSSGELCILCRGTLLQTAEVAGRKRSTAFTPSPFSPIKLVTCHQLELDSPACLVSPLRRKAKAACAWPSWKEKGAGGIFNLLVYQSLGNEMGVRITQICPCANVQFCLISKTAVMLAQGRILADQLSYFTMQ